MKDYRPEEYYLGLDIGTNSVGWAVTDAEYNLCRFKGKDMWGIRLFSEAKTAADRRLKRTNRRRLQRRKQRIDLLQMLFAEEIQKVDPTFFIRLNESKLHMDDKTVLAKKTLFNDPDFTDIEYYKKYPTIYRLRKELLLDESPHDIRLVYLALHHIIKYRGHFLFEGGIDSTRDFNATYEVAFAALNDTLGFEVEITDREYFESILRDKALSKSDRAKKIEMIMQFDHDADKETLKKRQVAVKEVCKLIAGNQGDIRKIYYDTPIDTEESLTKFRFSDSKFEEQIVPELESVVPDEIHAISMLKTIYDWSVLVDILGNEEYFSVAKDKQYEEHKMNLASLKYLMKRYCKKEIYKDFFDGIDSAGNYASYIGSVKTKGKKFAVKKVSSEEEFYKTTKRILDEIESSVSDSDKNKFNDIYIKVERETLLPLQRSKSNGVVPKQIHEYELVKILDNAKRYLPFLNEKDQDGLSTSDKIISIFNYRIPYYVGPLSSRNTKTGSSSWMVRREGMEEVRIYPWNIENIIDYGKSNEAFIERMTNKCTYLPWEDVLPKNSLLYQRFMVLNELNNLKIRGRYVTVSVKQQIYNDLFEKKNKVRGKDLLNYLRKEDRDLTLEDLSGFDIDFKASLSSYLDFKNKVFGDRVNEDGIKQICEDIIRWSTIYGDDSKMLEEVVKENYGDQLSSNQIKAIRKLRYTGWGNFSRTFLESIEGTDKETGEVFSIIGGLWETNNNLMQLLSSRFTFRDGLDALVIEHSNVIDSISYESLVDGLYTSPSNKRAIWQTIQIAEEIRKIMGREPKKIFVEMARGGEKEKKRTVSRKQRLIDLYEACDKDIREWALEDINSRDERDFNSMKLYLYYTQMGRCAYTGEHIDLDALMQGNSKWDRDHIYPQSKIKDDSIDNLVLVKKTDNARKSNDLLSSDVQSRMYPTWKMWLEKGLISKKKFDRLTRKEDFTIDELSGFVARQLVETRQSTKIVADLLDRMYADSKIVRVKAGLVSDFRKEPLKVLKSRRVNDYHHAKDAYLNIVVGNVYSVRFTDNPREWVKENRDRNWSINKVFNYDVKGAWKASNRKTENGDDCTGTIDLIRKTVRKNTILYTELTYCETGALFNETIQRKGKPGAIPLKKGLTTDRYGGYISPNTSYFALIEFDGKKGDRVKNIIGVPIYIANMLQHDCEAFTNYCKEIKGLKNVVVLNSRIKKNALMIVNGFPMRVRGENERLILFKGGMQPLFGRNEEELIRKIEKWLSKDYRTIVEKEDKINSEELEQLYLTLEQKLKSGVYKNRPANQWKKLAEGRESFEMLATEDKARCINEILGMLRCDVSSTADLRLIGGSQNAGSLAYAKNTLGNMSVVLVNQSVTGLFENRTEL